MQENTWVKSFKKGMVSFGSQSQSVVHHGGAVMGAGSSENWPYYIDSQEAEGDECTYSVQFPLPSHSFTLEP